jgi:peptide/nickel transport system ATP-binding protein
MYLGKIVETGTAIEIFDTPLHPYTSRLLKSVPRADHPSGTPLDVIPGAVPVPINLPPQCGFFGRCDRAIAGRCNCGVPALAKTQEGRWVRCFLYHNESETDA